jgi:hypothetical protein
MSEYEQYLDELCRERDVQYVPETDTERERFIVPSSKGSATYEVRFVRRVAEEASLWNCTCPAASHGRDCRHVELVSGLTNAALDEFGY